MDQKIDDALVFFDVTSYTQRPAPINSESQFFQHISEKEFTTIVVAQRFESHCQMMVKLARETETSGPGYPGMEDSPYLSFGSIQGEERLLRETESDFTALLASAVTLDDLICNCACELDRSGVAWHGYARSPNGSERSRSAIRALLRRAYVAAGNDVSPLEWVAHHRHEGIHELYFYGAAIQKAGLVVFRQSPTDYKGMDYRLEGALTSRKVLEAIAATRKYIEWFYAETKRQASSVRGPQSPS